MLIYIAIILTLILLTLSVVSVNIRRLNDNFIKVSVLYARHLDQEAEWKSHELRRN